MFLEIFGQASWPTSTLGDVVAPGTIVTYGIVQAGPVNQWADDFRHVTGRFMTKVTGRDQDVHALNLDLCATWASVQGLLDALQAVCRSARVLVICDEHHHAAVEAAWGAGTGSAFADARFALVLTGTPIRTDGAQSVWLAYDDSGAIDQPEAGTYTSHTVKP